MYLVFCSAALLISASSASGQSDSLHTDERVIEELAETFESESGTTPVYDYLE